MEDAIKRTATPKIEKKEVKKGRPTEEKMIIFSDSHGRGLRDKVKDILSDVTVSSVVKPGAPMNEVIQSVESQCKLFSTNDCVVIMGGTNNLTINECEDVFRSLKRTLPKLSHTNVIVANIPQRYDLPPRYNRVVMECNKKLENICKHFRNTSVVDTTKLGRAAHTSHR